MQELSAISGKETVKSTDLEIKVSEDQSFIAEEEVFDTDETDQPDFTERYLPVRMQERLLKFPEETGKAGPEIREIDNQTFIEEAVSDADETDLRSLPEKNTRYRPDLVV